MAGVDYNGSIDVAKYWKNSIPVTLTDGREDAEAKSIAVSGTDVYVEGTEWNGKSYQDAFGYTHKKSLAKYWKNGQPVNLTDGTEDAEAKSIAVSAVEPMH